MSSSESSSSSSYSYPGIPAFPSRPGCEIPYVEKIPFESFQSIPCSITETPSPHWNTPLFDFPFAIPDPVIPACNCPEISTTLELYSGVSSPQFWGSAVPDPDLGCCAYDLRFHLALPSMDCPEFSVNASDDAGNDIPVTVSLVSDTAGDCVYKMEFSFPNYCPTITGTATSDNPDVDVDLDITQTGCSFEFAFSFSFPDWGASIQHLQDEIDDLQDELNNVSSLAVRDPVWL